MGWWGVHEPFASVNQQGLNSLRKLYRQRTRWFQGNLQVLAESRRLYARKLHGLRRIDALMALILPALQLIVGTAVLVALVLWIGFGIPYLPIGNIWLLLFFIQLSFGPTILGVAVIGRSKGWSGITRVLVILVPYILYTWLLWPVVFYGLFRQLRGNSTWSKTAREAVEPPPG